MAAKKKSDEATTGRLTSDMVMAHINKQCGDNTAHAGTLIPQFNSIPFGIFELDYSTYGGITEGVMHQWYGWNSAGKTTAALIAVREALRKYKDPKYKALLVDMEGTLDPTWAATLGVDMSRVIYLKPDTGNEAVDFLDAFLKADDIIFAVLDSIPACIPKAVADRSSEDVTVGKLAALMGNMCDKVLLTLRERKRNFMNTGSPPPTIIVINQFRASMALMGDPRKLPGGYQLGYQSFSLLEIKKKEILEKNEDGEEVVTRNEHTFVMKRYKSGHRTKEGKYEMICSPEHPLGQGTIDDNRMALARAKVLGYITGGGTSWSVHGIENKFPNLKSIADYMLVHPHEMRRLKRIIIIDSRIKKGLKPLPPDGFLLCHESELKPPAPPRPTRRKASEGGEE